MVCNSTDRADKLRVNSDEGQTGRHHLLVRNLPLASVGTVHLLRVGAIHLTNAAVCLTLGALFQPALDTMGKLGLRVFRRRVA